MTQIIRPLRWGYAGAPLPEKTPYERLSKQLTAVERRALARIWPKMALNFKVEEHRG